MDILHQLLAGSLAFFISRQQTSRRAFQEDMQYGGAQYIATGRGFSITSSSFLKRKQPGLLIIISICSIHHDDQRGHINTTYLCDLPSHLSVYTNYARSHIFPGFELGWMCVLFYILSDCIDCNMGAMTWGTWLVSASLIFSPFWFNPLTFSTSKVRGTRVMLGHRLGL